MSWLSLDERDNDPERLGVLLHAALSVDQLEDVSSPGTRSVTDLLDDRFEVLADGDGQILVLDDVHELRSQPALDALRHLVRHAPDQLNLVLASRADPAVGLEELRLDGRLGEIRNAELAFSHEETAELLTLHEVALAQDDVRVLWKRTEGWAAGLRLAACALQGDRDPARFVRSAAKTEAVMSDYLLRELLVRQDDAMQWFLLRTSIADRLTLELAELLSGDPQSSEHLAELARSGVVAAGLGDDGSYGYHALFGTLLRARLRRHEPDLARELHGRVAHWCLEQDRPSEAQQHFRAAEDWEMLGLLLAWRWLDATVDGQSLAGDLLPAGLEPTAVRGAVGLTLVAAADACRRANLEEASVYRDALDDLLARPDRATMGDLQSWDNERLVLDVTFGCAFGSDSRSRAASEMLAQTPSTDPSAPGLRRLGLLRGAELALDAGDLDQAACQLANLAEQSDSCWVSVEAAAFLALVEAARGGVSSASLRCAAVLRDTRGCATPRAQHAARLAAALCSAQQSEGRGAASSRAEPSEPHELASRLVRVVDRAVRAAITAQPSRLVSLDAAATAEHGMAMLVLNALGVVEVLGQDGRPTIIGGPGEQALALARTRLAAGDLAGADQRLTAWIDGDPLTAHPRTLVEALTVAAVAADGRQAHGDALRRINQALEVAGACGVFAPLLQQGTRVASLLDRHLSDLGDQMGTAIRLLDRLRPTGLGDLVERLTDREMEVLVHLPTLMSNAEIADGLHLSINTVKTHLKSVYRKLGVDGRRQAVVRGRELELI